MLSAIGRIRLLAAIFCALMGAVALAACGSSSSGSTGASSNPQTLLKQVFSSSKAVKSGDLRLSLSAVVKGSAEITTPVSITFAGPFSDAGAKPQSSFTIDARALGHTGTFGIITTGSGDFLSLEGADYTLPASAVGSLGSGSSTSGSLPGLSGLGIDPAHWLTNPTIVSTPTVAGVPVDRIRAGVDVSAFLTDVNTLLAKEVKSSSAAKSAGVPTSISAATMRKIEAAIKNPTVQLDVGRSDRIVRDLDLRLSIPITGTTSTELGGATSAVISLSTSYTDINQPQTITAPANPRPYAQLKTEINTLAGSLEGALSESEGTTGSTGTSTSGGTATTGSSGGTATTGSSSAGSTAAASKYANCINQAAGDVGKMQKCATLLDGAGG